MDLKGTLATTGQLTGNIGATGNLGAQLSIPPLIYPGIYSGPTVIIPEHEEQVLNTSNLLLTSNITVKAIPEPEFVQQIYDSGEIALEDTLFNGWTPSTTARQRVQHIYHRSVHPLLQFIRYSHVHALHILRHISGTDRCNFCKLYG